MAVVLSTLSYRMSFRDAKGWTFNNRIYITSDSGADGYLADASSVANAVRVATIAMTNCAFIGDSGLSGYPVVSPQTYGTNAEYPAAWDKAVMMFVDANGAVHRYRIGAPKLALFDTDGSTILNDGTQATVVAWIAAMKTAIGVAYVSSRAQAALTNFTGGVRRVGSQPRRFNEFIRSSHLVQGEGE